MGQTSIDLPDPLEEPHVGLTDTDELLSELAGREIDRLLAQQSKRSRAPASTPDAAAATAATPEDQPFVTPQYDFDPEIWADIAAPSPQPERRVGKTSHPLAWLNAPMAWAPEWFGSMLVKIAVIILINAVAIMAYVFFTRVQR